MSDGGGYALHPRWCGGYGAADSVRGTSCARRARSACALGMRALCLSAGAWSPFGSFGKVDGRDAGDRVLGRRAGIAAGMSSAPVARWGVAKVGDARAAAFPRNHTACTAHVFQLKIFWHSHDHHSGVR